MLDSIFIHNKLNETYMLLLPVINDVKDLIIVIPETAEVPVGIIKDILISISQSIGENGSTFEIRIFKKKVYNIMY